MYTGAHVRGKHSRWDMVSCSWLSVATPRPVIREELKYVLLWVSLNKEECQAGSWCNSSCLGSDGGGGGLKGGVDSPP